MSYHCDLSENEIDGLMVIAQALIDNGMPDVHAPVRADQVAEIIARYKNVSRATPKIPNKNDDYGPTEFAADLATLGLVERNAADVLDLSRSTIQNYKRGNTPDGKPSPIPFVVRLAIAALIIFKSGEKKNDHVARNPRE